MSAEKRTLSGLVIAAMRAAGWLRNDGYRLKDGFNKILTINEVKESKTRGAKEMNNFRIMGTTEDGPVSLPGSIIANARLVADTNIEAGAVVEGVWYREAIADVMQGSQVFNEAKGMDEDDFEFPEKLQIVGAVVDEDPDVEGSPRFPLRSFKYYNQVLRHHRKITGEDDAFMTRDEFKGYIEAETDRPKGVPESYKELELLDSIKKNDMRNWQFTLLLADVTE